MSFSPGVELSPMPVVPTSNRSLEYTMYLPRIWQGTLSGMLGTYPTERTLESPFIKGDSRVRCRVRTQNRTRIGCTTRVYPKPYLLYPEGPFELC